jgi:hypothetical protein
MRTALRLGALGIVAVLLVTGCAARGVRISELQNDFERYDDKTISVQGVVTDSWGIPLVPFQLYKVDDGTGEITVLSRSGRAPSKGVRVRVKGKINEFGNFGGRSIGLHIQEDDRKVTS